VCNWVIVTTAIPLLHLLEYSFLAVSEILNHLGSQNIVLAPSCIICSFHLIVLCCFVLLTRGWGRLETRPPVALGSSPELSAFTMSLAPPVRCDFVKPFRYRIPALVIISSQNEWSLQLSSFLAFYVSNTCMKSELSAYVKSVYFSLAPPPIPPPHSSLHWLLSLSLSFSRSLSLSLTCSLAFYLSRSLVLYLCRSHSLTPSLVRVFALALDMCIYVFVYVYTCTHKYICLDACGVAGSRPMYGIPILETQKYRAWATETGIYIHRIFGQGTFVYILVLANSLFSF